MYRCSLAEMGGATFFSVIRSRTSSWMPKGPRDNPRDDVMVSTVDVAHYFYSALLDVDGPIMKNDEVPDGPGTAVWHAITAAFYGDDYGEIAQRIVDSIRDRDFHAFSSWLWDRFLEGLKKVEKVSDRDLYFTSAKSN